MSKTLGAAGQGLLLVAIAGEHGVRAEDRLVELLGSVLFRRELQVHGPDEQADVAADTRAAEITGELAEPDTTPTLARIGGTVWRLGRALFAVEGELDKRPHGNFLHEGLGLLPVVGALGKYLGPDHDHQVRLERVRYGPPAPQLLISRLEGGTSAGTSADP